MTYYDLKIIWQDDRYKGKYRELLELMKRFKLCYELPNQTYIAPQLLNTNAPEYEWNDNQNLQLRYQYEFMPKGIISRFIVEMHRYIEETKVWRSGVILNHNNTRAKVIETYDSKEILINLFGNSKRDLLTMIATRLDEIHASYNRLKVQKLIPCNCQNCQNFQLTKQQEKIHFYSIEKLKERLANQKFTIECQNPPYDDINIYSLIDGTIGREQFNSSNQDKYTFIIGDKMTTNQIHSGDGDNVAGNKQTNTFNSPVGIGGTQGNIQIKDNATVAGVNNKYSSEELNQITQSITELINYLETNNNITKIIEKINTIKTNQPQLNNAEIIEVAIQNNPTLKQRLLSASSTTIIETIKAFLPPVGVAIEAIKAYNNPR
ncbi:MAG TPA: hypothetical protein DCF68_21215 [Cyanothece sp. UBA12306]|nr:hypothetical protein [Cyanothece sp. UBA12306]